MDTNTDQFTPLTLHVQGNNKEVKEWKTRTSYLGFWVR